MALGLLKALLISLQQCAQRHSSVQWPANSLLPVRSARASVTDARVQVKWNKFLNTDLAEKARADGKLTLADMAQVMNWKITKHTWRPLMGKLMSNKSADVEKCTADAIAIVRGAGAATETRAKQALTALSKMKGIGPATASAVLAHLDSRYPFMADEALEGCGLERDYKEKTYLALMRTLASKAKMLGDQWHAEHVGRAMWTAAMVHVHGLSVPQTAPTSAAAAATACSTPKPGPKPVKRRSPGDGAVEGEGSKKSKLTVID